MDDFFNISSVSQNQIIFSDINDSIKTLAWITREKHQVEYFSNAICFFQGMTGMISLYLAISEKKRMNFKQLIHALAFCLLTFSGLADSSQQHSVDALTGAQTWSNDGHGVQLSLTQILPDQLKAFYGNRGFTLEQIEAYTSTCVYMTVLRNDNADGTIHFIRENWSVIAGGRQHALVPVDEWVKRLTTVDTPKAALVAFRWAQFPVEQSYQPGGDWNQGMLSVALSPGTPFDLIAHWDIEGKPFQLSLKQVHCAK